jgi:hypothetical protein
MGGPPHTQEAGPWLTPATPGGATVAGKCENEKKALDEAEKESANFQYWMNRMDKSADEWEAEAQQELGSVGECIEPLWHGPSAGGMRWHTEGEYTLDEQCVIDKWVNAQDLLKGALNAREQAGDFMLEWDRWMGEADKREKKYCDCLNETPG